MIVQRGTISLSHHTYKGGGRYVSSIGMPKLVDNVSQEPTYEVDDAEVLAMANRGTVGQHATCEILQCSASCSSFLQITSLISFLSDVTDWNTLDDCTLLRGGKPATMSSLNSFSNAVDSASEPRHNDHVVQGSCALLRNPSHFARFATRDRNECFYPCRNDYLVLPLSRKYLGSVYWALTTLTTVGYGDLSARTVDEQVRQSFTINLHFCLPRDRREGC